jgi:hypothetical protein
MAAEGADGAGASGPEYEFTDEQNRTFTGLANGFSILGILLLVAAIKLSIWLGRAVWDLAARGAGPTAAERAIELLALLLVVVPLCAWMNRASGSFGAVASTRGRDITHLMTGLTAINTSFNWLIGLIIAGLLLGLGVTIWKMF